MSLPPSRRIWFELVESDTGKPYKGMRPAKVLLPPDSDVDDLQTAVHQKISSKLFSVDSVDLLIYRNKGEFEMRNATGDDEKKGPLDPFESIDLLGSKEDMLVVVVPSSVSSSQITSEQKVDPKRKHRWLELNEVLEGHNKKSKTNDSTVAWNDVESIFSPVEYVQPRRPIDDDQLSFLEKYLSFAKKCFGVITTGSDAKRLHFIAPILICVCVLFDDVEMVVEKDLVGRFVKAHGHFEFMFRRGNKVVCILEAKKDDVEQGMAQDLIGCEVAAELGGLDIVYGIVTNYIHWNFLRSLNDKVEIQECALRLTPYGPERESLREITEKIYDILS